MKIFLLDKSIEGILSALYVSFTEKILPDSIDEKTVFQPQIDALVINIATNRQHSDRVKKALFKYGGNDIIAHMKICLKSNDPKCLLYTFNYGYLTLFERADISNKLNNKIVSDFSFTLQKVLHERHIMTGFLRFKESAGGVLYAQYSPDNDITDLLAPHFLRRLGNSPFIIHDLKRNILCISNGKAVQTTYTTLAPNFSPSEDEETLNELWKRYYKEINIKERRNIRQQDHFIPRRYRKYAFETWE